MANDNINFEQSTASTFSSSPGNISTLRENEDVIISRPANHNEISIMESQWKQIRNKVNKIQLKRHIDFSDLFIGALIPYCIDIVSSIIAQKEPNYFPAFVCIILFIGYKWLAKKLSIFSTDNMDTNIMHLQELNELLDQADSSPNL